MFFLLILLMAELLSRDSMTSKCYVNVNQQKGHVLYRKFLNYFQEDTDCIWTTANYKYTAIFSRNQET